MRRLKAAIPGRVPARECVCWSSEISSGTSTTGTAPRGPAGPRALERGHPLGWRQTPPPPSFQAPSLGPMLLKGCVENNLHPQVYVA